MKRATGFLADRIVMGSFARWTALWVALLAMAFQTLLFAEHVSASAARNATMAGPDARLGFLEICTGDGIVVLSNGETAPGSELVSNCLICASAAVAGFDQPAPATVPNCAFDVIARLDAPRVVPAPRVATPQDNTPIRAPPARA